MTRPQFLVVSALPHARSSESVQRMMLIMIAALIPAFGCSIVLHGMRAVLAVLAGAVAAGATDWLHASLRDRRVAAIDGSSCLTGTLLALSLPPPLPFWVAGIGAVFAVVVVKIVAGGLGRNFLNPALAGRAFLVFAVPAVFAVTTPQGNAASALAHHPLVTLLLGYQAGWLGTSTAALLLGAIALWWLRTIDFSLPLAFIGSAFFLFWISNGPFEMFHAAGLLAASGRMIAGGVLLVAIFMAPDPVTSPAAKRARILFGIVCGALTVLFETFGTTDEGAMHAVLLMNLTVPFMDRYFRRRVFGGGPGPAVRTPEITVDAAGSDMAVSGESPEAAVEERE